MAYKLNKSCCDPLYLLLQMEFIDVSWHLSNKEESETIIDKLIEEKVNQQYSS